LHIPIRIVLPNFDLTVLSRSSLHRIDLPSPRRGYFQQDKPDKKFPRKTYFDATLMDICPNLYSSKAMVNNTFHMKKFDLMKFKNIPIDMNDVLRRAISNSKNVRGEVNIAHLSRPKNIKFKSEAEKQKYNAGHLMAVSESIESRITEYDEQQNLEREVTDLLCQNYCVRAYLLGVEHTKAVIVQKRKDYQVKYKDYSFDPDVENLHNTSDVTATLPSP